MQTLRKKLSYTMGLFFLLLFGGQSSFSETAITEYLLPADIIVEQVFQAGSGLPVGKIQAVRGEVIVYHRNPAVGYRLKTGLPLYSGDTIHTRENGRILCRLIGGTKVSLAPETTLTILQCNHNSARKTSVSFLLLKHGVGHFQVKPLAEVFSHEFKIQTMTAFAQAGTADFIMRANQNTTEIMALDGNRLEVTNLTAPEVFFFLTDFQKTVVADKSDSQVVETVSQDEAGEMIAQIRLMPQSQLFASSAERYLEEDTASEGLEPGGIADEQ